MQPISVNAWKDFFDVHALDIEAAAEHATKENNSLIINCSDLDETDNETNEFLSDELRLKPIESIKNAQTALKDHYCRAREQGYFDGWIRFMNFGRKIAIKNLRAENINTMVAVEGIVVKITSVRPRIVVATYECTRCNNVTNMEQDVAVGGGKCVAPSYCTCNEEKKGSFKLLQERSVFEDYQKIRIQENMSDLKGGERPQTLDVYVTHDLVGKAIPGQHVVVNGILRSTQKSGREGATTHFDVYLDGNYVEIDQTKFADLEPTPEEEVQIIELSRKPDIHSIITGCIAPTIFGHEDIKEAIALQLFGGMVKERVPNAPRVRGDIHIMIVGDPGIAKSQLLRYVATTLAPHGIYTGGRGTSSAGLTAAAVKDHDFDEGKWILEAGAMVLADGGILCVDELDKMKVDDRSALHEAMEGAQTVTITKVGIHMTLQTRCSVLIAANPKHSKFDPDEPLVDQVDMLAALISRFDLIFTLRDIPNVGRDMEIASHIIDGHVVGSLAERQHYIGDKKDEADAQVKTVTPKYDPAFIRKYVAYARKKCYPIMTPEAKNAMIDFYMKMRANAGTKGKDAMPVTARQLEALVRLSEASARIRLGQEVTKADADRAINLTMISLRQTSTDPETGEIDIGLQYSGETASMKERYKEIVEIIRENSRGNPGAELEMILERTRKLNYNDGTIQKDIKKMCEKGYIFEHSPNLYRVSK